MANNMSQLSWIFALIRINFDNMWMHRRAFITSTLAMMTNNLIMFFVWYIVFMQSEHIGGWTLEDMTILFGCAVIGFGLFHSILGGTLLVTEKIYNGSFDLYLARPHSPLLLCCLSQFRTDAVGDAISGIVLLILFANLSLIDIPLVVFIILTTGLVQWSFIVIIQALTFWARTTDVSNNMVSAFLIASSTPLVGMDGLARIVLLTIFPAGYISLIPVEMFKNFSWELFMLQLVGSVMVLIISHLIFQRGLRRYTSGNMFSGTR